MEDEDLEDEDASLKARFCPKYSSHLDFAFSRLQLKYNYRLHPPADSVSDPLCRPDVESFELSSFYLPYEDALVLNYPCPKLSCFSLVKFAINAYSPFPCEFNRLVSFCIGSDVMKF